MKLVTFNTQWCCGVDGVVSPQRIVDAARQMADFDVLCLQEISVNYPGLAGNPGHDQPTILAGLLPGFQVFFGAAVDECNSDGERRQFGNLVATRLPVAQLQHHALPYPADAGVRSMPRMCTVVTVGDAALGAVRVMTAHLEFYSKAQRMAQAHALRGLHEAASAHAATPPKSSDDGSPFQTKPHTKHAVLCGDFNFGPQEPEYAVLTDPRSQAPLSDCWQVLHGAAPHPPTFRLFDRSHGPEPVTSDFVFVSSGLKDRVKRWHVDAGTQASDHQPVLVELE